MALLQGLELPACTPEALAGAVRRSLERQTSESAAPSVGPGGLSGRLPPSTRFEQGAEALAKESPEDAAAAEHMLALLEAAYLVAAADGLADQEKEALSELIVQMTGRAMTPERLARLFDRFEHSVADEGLEKRLDAVAAVFDDFMAREEAMSFAALVAIADGVLADREAAALIAFGRRFDFSVGEVQAVVDAVAATLKGALEP